MYKLPDGQMDMYAVYSPLEKLLDPENRFVRWAAAIPWETLEETWSGTLYAHGGAPAKPLRVTLGAYLIHKRFGFSARETLRQITENPYMQYFVGMQEFSRVPPFNHTLLTQFERRLTPAARKTVRRLIRESMK